MNSLLESMIVKYQAKTTTERKNAIKEVVQEIILSGLSRAGFFKSSAFYGGTALRIFHGLNRFSEDLDFSLLSPDSNFSLDEYLATLEKEINSLGLNFKIEQKQKSKVNNVKSSFLKGNTREHLLIFYQNSEDKVAATDLIKIKFEIDINPPKYATYEVKYKLLPFPYEVKLYDIPSLFASKIHAVVCRDWNNRVKGRDLYDYIFYLQIGATINLDHLEERFKDSGFAFGENKLTINILKKILKERFENIDYNQAKEDVSPFISDSRVLDIWSKEFFIAITDNLK